MQRYSQRVFPWPSPKPELIPDTNGTIVLFADIPPVPEPEPWLDQPDGPGDWKYRAHYMFAGDYLLTRLFLNDKGKLLTRSGTAVSRMNGKWQRISQVPEPLPWLDQPDGEGGWKYVPDIDPNEWELFRLFDDTEIGLWFYSSSGRAVAKRLSKGRWQRIPQPTLPVEDA